jgi:hypothetical protein
MRRLAYGPKQVALLLAISMACRQAQVRSRWPTVVSRMFRCIFEQEPSKMAIPG